MDINFKLSPKKIIATALFSLVVLLPINNIAQYKIARGKSITQAYTQAPFVYIGNSAIIAFELIKAILYIAMLASLPSGFALLLLASSNNNSGL